MNAIRTLTMALLAGAGLAGPAHALTYTLTPAQQSVAPGDSYDVGVSLSQIGTAPLGAFELLFSYDPSLLSLNGVTFGPSLGDPAAFEALTSTTNPAGNEVDVAEVSLLSDADLAALQGAPALTLATLSFQALGSGVATLDLLAQTAADGDGNVLPEPAGTALLATGLGALGLLRRRPAA